MNKLMFHHCMPLEGVVYDKVKADKEWSIKLDEFPDEPKFSFVRAYEWIEKEVGFWPFWVAVGSRIDDIRMTGYDAQWRKRLSYCYADPSLNKYRKKGEYPNNVLFSWDDLDGVFTCYSSWHIVLGYPRDVKPHEKRMIFKYSWTKSRWLREARKPKNYGVQMVTPELDLRTAERIWTRNQQTKKKLEDMGFRNVIVKRLKLQSRD